MATKQKKALELGCVAMDTIIFQAEVYAIKACIDENLERGYRNRNIYILSDRKAAIKALGKYQITSNPSTP
jgi:hypothetical protein